MAKVEVNGRTIDVSEFKVPEISIDKLEFKKLCAAVLALIANEENKRLSFDKKHERHKHQFIPEQKLRKDRFKNVK